MRKKVRTT